MRPCSLGADAMFTRAGIACLAASRMSCTRSTIPSLRAATLLTTAAAAPRALAMAQNGQSGTRACSSSMSEVEKAQTGGPTGGDTIFGKIIRKEYAAPQPASSRELLRISF